MMGWGSRGNGFGLGVRWRLKPLNRKMKTVKERDDLELLTLVCELHARSLNHQTKVIHDASVEARQELEARLKAYKYFGNVPVTSSNAFERLPKELKYVYYMVGGIVIGLLLHYCL